MERTVWGGAQQGGAGRGTLEGLAQGGGGRAWDPRGIGPGAGEGSGAPCGIGRTGRGRGAARRGDNRPARARQVWAAACWQVSGPSSRAGVGLGSGWGRSRQIRVPLSSSAGSLPGVVHAGTYRAQILGALDTIGFCSPVSRAVGLRLLLLSSPFHMVVGCKRV